MPHTIDEIARYTGLRAEGDLALSVNRPAEPAAAGPDDLALAMRRDYAEALGAGQACAAVLWEGAEWRCFGLKAALFAPRPRVALAGLGEMFAPPLDLAEGCDPSAAIDPSAEIGPDCWIGPFVAIAPRARIGAGARIGAHVTIGADAVLGADALVYPGVRIGPRVEIGPRAILQPGAVIGADGFSFVTPERGAVESAKQTGAVAEDSRNTALRRITSLGTVTIGPDVEIGAGTTIDRGTVGATRIGAGTKIDNLVQIGHNCSIGEICLICGQVGLAGSVVIGDRVVIGGQVGIGDHLNVGSDSVLAGGSLVGANIPPNSVMMGAPAAPRDQVYQQVLALKRLPRLVSEVRAIRKKLGL